MFTGIIETTGTVNALEPRGEGRRIRIDAAFANELRVDESVAVNGACLTVVSRDQRSFEADVVEETLAKTSLGDLAAGRPVNLERAMPADGRFDGHFVQGHVDTVGEVVSIDELDTSTLVSVRFPEGFEALVIPQGSITIDGISLTIARLDGNVLTVAIIPHTQKMTTAGEWVPGSRVNLEFDLLGKYVARTLALMKAE